jgi:hypothetical protein
MKDENFSITITPKTVMEWQNEAKALLESIQKDTARYNLLEQRIKAVGLFRELERPTKNIPIGSPNELAGEDLQTETATRLGNLAPPAAIISLLREAGGQTMPLNVIRQKLLSAGYPPEKLGRDYQYFYTVIKRLKGSKRIVKDGNGVRLSSTASGSNMNL